MNGNFWDICITDTSETSRFAAAEFARLISAMDSQTKTAISECGFTPERHALWIGLDDALPTAPPVAEPEFDDAIRIEVENGSGFITGSNARSVLIGVYRFFRESGCVFVRPGRDGEYVPHLDSMGISVRVCERAAYRCRGICLEGANSYENVAEMVDFAPKLGFNAYFTQLFRPAFAFRRWYEHFGNPAVVPTPVSNATIDSFVNDYDAEIRRRGLLHHRIGHGWMSKILGIVSGAWHEGNREDEVVPERRDLIAFINGERRLFKGSGIDTNLCYSDPRVREQLAAEVVDYARRNPDTHYVHFWFADQANNQCECARCRDVRPADLYVDLLNRIDERLSEENIPTKIVFLIYLDLLWAPVASRLKHPERFVLMYAPIRRSYSVPMAEDDGHRAAPFVRNGFVPTAGAGDTLPYLREWQQVFDGDSFIFDYHYMWDYINDPGGIGCARIMEQDVENLGKLGLNGMMSCQNQRVFMPSGAGMCVMGEALWSGRADFSPRAERYFAAAFGADGGKVMAFLERLSCDFDPPVLRGEKPIRSARNVAVYAALPKFIDDFLPVIRANLDRADTILRRRSWECLAFHAGVCRGLAAVLLAYARGDGKTAQLRWAEVRTSVCENELGFQREFDVFEFLLVWENKILPRFQAKTAADVE